jgi:hypothetical protein
VADRADGGPCAAEELLPVAVEAGGVFRVVCDVGEGRVFVARLLPVRRRRLVAGVAGLPLVLGRRVRELRVVNRGGGGGGGGRPRRCRLCGSGSAFAPAAPADMSGQTNAAEASRSRVASVSVRWLIRPIGRFRRLAFAALSCAPERVSDEGRPDSSARKKDLNAGSGL